MKPFRGTIKAIVATCSKPLSNGCKTVEDGAEVVINSLEALNNGKLIRFDNRSTLSLFFDKF